jgi:hypothetical protein
MDRSEICCSTHGDGKPDVPCLHSPTGLIRDRYRRMDSSRLENTPMGVSYGSAIADSSIERVVRFDADDPLSKAARDAAKRMFLQTVRTDEEREKRLAQFDRKTAHREWLERFHAGLVAKQNAERARPDLDGAARAAERRINEQWRPKS